MNNSDVERVLDAYGKLVYRTAYVRLASHDASAVDDVYQDVFLKYITSPPRAEPGSPAERAWFVRCTINRCKDVFRDARHKSSSELDGSIIAGDTGSEGNMALDVLMSIPEKYRMPMYLYYVCGYDCAECAKMLELGGAALRMRLVRGRKLFELAWYGEEHAPQNIIAKE
jgi:RNA polymerase sigma-70 factor (ECF subfamily)